MNNKVKGLIEIHIATFLFGFAALFGKFLAISPVVIVFGRTLFAAITLGIILLFSKESFKLRLGKDYLFLFLIGSIYVLHWLAFFQSVQISSVAICVLTFSTFPIFVTFLEPYFFREKIKTFDIIIAFITLFGVVLVIPKFEITNNLTQGALWGLAAGISFAVLIIANKKNIQEYSSLIICFYQNLTCAVILMPFIIYLKPVISFNDIILLILLGVLFTAITQVIYIRSLTNITAQLASIVISLEPVYAIIFACIFVNEIPTIRTVIGGFTIVGAIFIATFTFKSKVIQSKHSKANLEY